VCGIVGFVDPEHRLSEAEILVERMAGSLRHRGPDDGGFYVDKSSGVTLGHRRLAIVDQSDAGGQPMSSPNGAQVLVFNGELYNHREVRKKLEARGARFRGASDTEVLSVGLQEWGVGEFLKHAVGMFAFAVWDVRARTLTLVRDRMGEKPLYFGWIDGVFAFASELKALTLVTGWTGAIDDSAIRSYLRYSCVPGSNCIYEGIAKVPPASIVTLKGDTGSGHAPSVVQYWSPAAGLSAVDTRAFEDDQAAIDSVDNTLKMAIDDQRVADVPLGAFLSGGVDSSLVVAVMQSLAETPVRSFTIGFEESLYDEAADARRVAEFLGTRHTEFTVTSRDAFEVIPKLADIYDEPFGDVSQIPTFLVSQLTKRDVTVSLSGDGGDEMFGGYNRHVWAPRIWDRLRKWPLGIRRVVGQGMGAIPANWMNVAGDRGGSVLPPTLRHRLLGDKVQKLAQVLDSRSLGDLHERLVSQGSGVRSAADSSGASSSMNAPSWPIPTDLSVAEQLMWMDMQTYLPDDILVKVDRASMAESLEVRTPFLDHRVVELAWALPLKYKIRERTGKWVLRELLNQYVPSELTNRPKKGFGVPIGVWLKGPLRDWAEDLLTVSSLEQSPWVNTTEVREAWAHLKGGQLQWEHQIWTVLMFQAWMSRWGSVQSRAAGA
jgi:asparagine synthase (glutamine-hydrolysing)